MKKYIPILALLNVFTLTMCAKPVPNEVNISTDELPSTFSVHTTAQVELLTSSDMDHLVGSDVMYGRRSLSKPNPLHLSWSESNDINQDADRYEVLVSEDNSFTNPIKYTVTDKSLDIYNLKINTPYYFRVDSIHGKASFPSSVLTYTIEDVAPRNIYIDGVENVRDLGGWTLDNGKTYKQGLIYRTGQFNYGGGLNTYQSAPTEQGLKTLKEELRIKTDIDLRKNKAVFHEDEINSITASPIGDDVNYVACPMRFGNENIFTQEINKNSVRLFFTTLADINNYPVVFHCMRGTDRTGALAYVLGALVGMSKEQLLRDYMFSNIANIGSRVYTSGITGEGFYVQGIDNSEGSTLSEKTKNYLITTCGVDASTIDTVVDILTD